MRIPALLLAVVFAATPALVRPVLAQPVLAQNVEVDLELMLLADASGSIDDSEIEFQRRGYATAIADPQVIRAITSNFTGTIAVTYVEWAANQAIVVDWTVIDSTQSARAFAAALLEPPRMAYGRNAIGAALLDGKRSIEGNSIDSLRRVIDFSGDSINNWSGPTIEDARAEVLASGITINALPILRPDDPGRAQVGLEAAYESRLIGGPGAFMVTAKDRASFAEAVRRKLILEISGIQPGTPAAQLALLP